MDTNEDHDSKPRRMPAATERDIASRGLPNDKESLLFEAIYPDDAYKGQTYWADLPNERADEMNQPPAQRRSWARAGLDMAALQTRSSPPVCRLLPQLCHHWRWIFR